MREFKDNHINLFFRVLWKDANIYWKINSSPALVSAALTRPNWALTSVRCAVQSARMGWSLAKIRWIPKQCGAAVTKLPKIKPPVRAIRLRRKPWNCSRIGKTRKTVTGWRFPPNAPIWCNTRPTPHCKLHSGCCCSTAGRHIDCFERKRGLVLLFTYFILFHTHILANF